MAFTLPELREELQALGYGGVPDHVIVSSLSQLKLDLPPSWNDEKDCKYRCSSRRDIREGKSSRQAHGSPVPGDREFAKFKESNVIRKGLDAVCFTPDFATELDEMRKMLRIMEGKREELLGSMSSRSTGKRMGLADEHEHYVDNLMDQWRLVGRSLRAKRNGCPAKTGDICDRPTAATNFESRTYQLEKPDIILGTRLPPTADSGTGGVEARGHLDVCQLQKRNGKSCDDGVAPLDKLDRDEENTRPDKCLLGKIEKDDQKKGTGTVCSSINSKEIESSASKSGKAVNVRDDKSPVFTRQEGSSAISPGASYQQGGMLYPEIFIDRCKHSHQHSNEKLFASHQEPWEDRWPSPPSPATTPKLDLDKLSTLCNDQFLAAFGKSLEDLDPQDTIDQETFENVNQKITDTVFHPHVNFCSRAARSVESENPLDLSVPVLRTPDRRGGGHQSPLNDRSNIRIGEGTVVPQPSGKAVFKITECDSAVTVKRNSAVTLKRSRSSRERVEADGTHLSDIAEDRLDSRLSAKKTPPSGRKIKAEKAFRRTLSEKDSPRVPPRNNGASDPSHLDISSLVLSPIKVREPASPFKLSSRERAGVANELPEHRPGTCTVCPPPSVRKSGDSNSHGVVACKSPFGKNLSSVSSEHEASPKQKQSLRKEVKVSPKQKLPLRKGLGPSGIYTPLFDQKKHDINSKVLFKTSRSVSSMDFNSESLRPAERRATSLRSSTESSRSSGPQRAASSQSSKSTSGSSPFAKSSSYNSVFSSRSATSKDTLTPGGPRRGGKVDRVARFAEMQNLWKNDNFLKTSSKRKPQSFHRIFARLHLSHERYTAAYRERVLEDMRPRSEPAPFVLPSLYSTSDRVTTDRARL